jgi:hypothetical protein
MNYNHVKPCKIHGQDGQKNLYCLTCPDAVKCPYDEDIWKEAVEHMANLMRESVDRDIINEIIEEAEDK